MNELLNQDIINESDFIFIKSGNVYIIEKDRYNALYPFVALTEIDIHHFILSKYHTTIINPKGEVIMQNFESKEKKTYDLTNVHELLTEVETAYITKEKLLEDIDKALSEGDRVTFMLLTEQLKMVS